MRLSSGKSTCWIIILTFLCVVMSALVTFSMIVVSYPGDECLLFVGVRGEALIYGNPAGCNFVAYGHAVLIIGALWMLFMLFCRPKKGFVKKKSTSQASSLPHNNPFNYWAEPSERGFATGRFSRFYSVKPIILALLLATVSLVIALVAISGYFVTCDELEYEAQRHINRKVTLGKPFKTIGIMCWSLFRDNDFHTRFHFDHYEYRGMWHGQYRGYEHGKVHQFDTKHEHIIGVALALELSISGAWLSSLFWFAVMSLMIHLKLRARTLKRRELAESQEDARIFADSRRIVDGGFPETINGSNSVLMNPITDQVSIISNQSCVQKQPQATMVPSGHRSQTQSLVGYPVQQPYATQQVPVTMNSQVRGSAPVLQQQILTQQEMLSQQMQQMQLLQQQSQQQLAAAASQPQMAIPGQQVQYVQLQDGRLVPTVVAAGATMPPAVPVSSATLPRNGNGITPPSQPLIQSKSCPSNPPVANGLPSRADTNDRSAQDQQIHLSKDIGLKCSQI